MSISGVKVEGHNTSAQENVILSHDPALDISHEHHHEHLHHGHAAGHGHDGAVYSEGTTHDSSMIPNANPVEVVLNQHERMGQHHDGEKKNSAVYAVDTEKGDVGSSQAGGQLEFFAGEQDAIGDPKNRRVSRFYARYRIFFHLLIFLLFTGWWIASLILHRHDKNWIVPFLLWGAITLRLIFFHVPSSLVMRPVHWAWNQTGVRVCNWVPEKMRVPAGALLVIAVILIGSFASPESEDNTRENRAVSLFGVAVFIFVLWATSNNRKLINWHTVCVGMLVQFIVALFVLRSGAGYDIFNFISSLADDLLGFAKNGVSFLTDADVSDRKYFLVSVVPAITFFVSLVSVLYHWGTLQWFVQKAAVFFFWSMRVSGAEAVVAAASPFIGQGESAMLIKPFIAHLTKAEIHQVMTSGFATISGSVLVAYIALGVNGTALISSCVMSIPASLAFSKLRYPETEETLTAGRVVIPDDDEHRAANALHAFANGAWLGIKISGMIVATLLCIIALVALINGLLTWWGHYLNINDPTLTLELILGYLCYPIAFLLGVPRQKGEIFKVAQLIGVKIIENEFVAYNSLQTDAKYADLSPRSRLIVTYALCGFGNVGSLGTQIGVLSQICPGRSGDVSRVALSALATGIMATLVSASIAGMLVTDQRAFFTPVPAGGS